MRLLNWSTKIARTERPFASARAFGPNCLRLRAASASVRPLAGSVWRARATSSADSVSPCGETARRRCCVARRRLRRESYNRAALRAAAQLVPPDATLDIFELDGIPGFNQDEEQNPPAKVVELKRRIREADAVLFVTPEYNYSVPGVLKNAIDWASRPYGDSAWSGKPAAIMGASVGAIGTARRNTTCARSWSS